MPVLLIPTFCVKIITKTLAYMEPPGSQQFTKSRSEKRRLFWEPSLTGEVNFPNWARKLPQLGKICDSKIGRFSFPFLSKTGQFPKPRRDFRRF